MVETSETPEAFDLYLVKVGLRTFSGSWYLPSLVSSSISKILSPEDDECDGEATGSDAGAASFV